MKGKGKEWRELSPEKFDEQMLRDAPLQVMLAFMRASPMPTLVTDPLGHILFMNQPMENYIKLRVWDVRGKRLADVLHMTEQEARTADSKRNVVIEKLLPMVSLELFRMGAQRLSTFSFAFYDSNSSPLVGYFLLPHNGSPGAF